MVKNDYKRENFLKMTRFNDQGLFFGLFYTCKMICIIEEVDMHNRGSRLNMAHKANDATSQLIEFLNYATNRLTNRPFCKDARTDTENIF